MTFNLWLYANYSRLLVTGFVVSIKTAVDTALTDRTENLATCVRRYRVHASKDVAKPTCADIRVNENLSSNFCTPKSTKSASCSFINTALLPFNPSSPIFSFNASIGVPVTILSSPRTRSIIYRYYVHLFLARVTSASLSICQTFPNPVSDLTILR